MSGDKVLDPISVGHYHRKQLECKSNVIAWSHGARFKMGLRLLGPSPAKLLDYGCGDGTFLAMAADRIQQGWGADLAVDQILDCQARYDRLTNLQFSTIDALSDQRHQGAYDVVTCMETLEHCVPSVVEIVLRDLARLVSPTGRVIISVPIEIGPSFLFKLIIRKIAAWRGLSDYKYYESYTLSTAMRMIFAGKNTIVDRPIYGGEASPYYSHYGFNWRVLRECVRNHLVVEKTLFSPLGFLGGYFSSQAWFVCRRNDAAVVS
jgi:SAM-dependent methyltransferase